MAEKHAYFAGGCFWCITPVFKIYGASEVISGYSGGDEANPKYEDVKAQRTGHRETIKVTYDSEEVDYAKLVEIYLANVDPFDEGGQYMDRGFSYTLAIYYQNEDEKAIAQKAIDALQHPQGKKAAVALEAFKSFYPAEEYHQDYYLKNPESFENEISERKQWEQEHKIVHNIF